MTVCAKFTKRPLRDCTRGRGCVCRVERMAEILLKAAYPRRGTFEDFLTRDDIAAQVQADFGLTELLELAAKEDAK